MYCFWICELGPVLSGNLAAKRGVETQLQTTLLILCKYGLGHRLILWGGEVVTVGTVVCEQGEEGMPEWSFKFFPRYSFRPHRDQVQKGTSWHLRRREEFLNLPWKAVWVSGPFFFLFSFFLTGCILFKMSFTQCWWVWVHGNVPDSLWGWWTLTVSLALWSHKTTRGMGEGNAEMQWKGGR